MNLATPARMPPTKPSSSISASLKCLRKLPVQSRIQCALGLCESQLLS